MDKKSADFTKAFIVYKGRFVSLLRDDKPTIPNPNKWETSGGAIDEGESPEEGIRRELVEEISVCPKFLVPLTTIIFTNQDGHYYYGILTDEESSKLKLGNEGQDMKLYNLAEVKRMNTVYRLQYLFANYKTFFERLLHEDLSAIDEIPKEIKIDAHSSFEAYSEFSI